MVLVGEPGREIVETVCHVLQAGEEYQWGAGTAPVEHFELHVRGDGDETDRMG